MPTYEIFIPLNVKVADYQMKVRNNHLSTSFFVVSLAPTLVWQQNDLNWYEGP